MHRRRGLRATALALAMALSSGCYKATFIQDPTAVKGVEHDEWLSFFVFGLVNEQDVDVHQFCPDGRVALVETHGNFLTGLVSALTIGIYTPRKVNVTCAGGAQTSRLELDVDSAGRPVAAQVKDAAGRMERLTVTAVGPETFHLTSAGVAR